MNGAAGGIELEYVRALREYLDAQVEQALSEAYGLGRRALAEGLGVLDMASLHARALVDVTPAGAEDERRRAQCATAFLREVLSPYEMSFRGYHEANERLREANAALLAQKEAVETANRELEAFSYSVSHDLRAPLRSIDGFSQALIEDYADVLDETGRRYLRYVRESAQDMARLIDGLLSLARVTRAELHLGPVDLGQVARRIAEQLRAAEPARAVELVIPERLPATADPTLAQVLLRNLLGNAWKFTSKKGSARIELGSMASEDGRAVYFVRDDGAGFDMAYAPKLFGAFQRLHTSREFEGTGIGLATVQRIVHRHGGEIWAEAEVGRGATFYFTLGPGEARP